MPPTDQEVIIAILSGSGLLILLVGIIIVSAIRYNARQREHLLQIKAVEEAHQREMLKANIEVKEQTLQNIAHEIHDNVGQVLSLVKLNLNIASQKAQKW